MFLFLHLNDTPRHQLRAGKTLRNDPALLPYVKAQRRDMTCPRQRKIRIAASWGTLRSLPTDDTSATKWKQTWSSPSFPEPNPPAPEWTSYHSLPPEVLKTYEVRDGESFGFLVKVYVLGL